MIGDLVADALVVVGLLLLLVAVYGTIRLGDPLDQLHASGKAAFIGIVALLVAAGLSAGLEAAGRALLLALLLTVTAPVGAHAIAELAALGEDHED